MQGDALLAELRELDLLERQVRSKKVRVIAQIANQQVAQDKGYPGVVQLLVDVLRLRQATANELVSVAERIGPRQTMTGQPLEPRLPATAAAMATGELHADHYRVITQAVDYLGARVSDAQIADLEAELAELGKGLHPYQLTQEANRAVTELDQDGPAPKEPAEQSGNRLRLQPKLDGGAKVSGELDAEGYAVVSKVINSLNEPVKGPYGEHDQRTKPHRDGDALVEACRRLLKVGKLPTGGGVRPQVSVMVDWDTLRGEVGEVILNTGQKLAPAEGRMMACDAKILPVVMNGKSLDWDVGKAKYVVSKLLREALILRDQHCAFPGCQHPPEWCHAHHLVSFFRRNGLTEIENLCLLCPMHHRLVHASEWEIKMINRRPWFIPPAFIDPERRPLFNGDPRAC